MAHDELKQKGNECVREGNYADAVGYYSKALTENPSSHAVYSNRSLAHFKLGNFAAALDDANKCIELAPTFARGRLRKSVALTGLAEYEAAMSAAEEGYKLRGSDAICRDCVAQWLEANKCQNRGVVKSCLLDIGLQEDVIPKGCRVVSSEYMTIFLNILLCRLEYATTGISVEFMGSLVLALLKELDRILALFGHSLAEVSKEWLACLFMCSKLDPTTSRVPQPNVTDLLAKADEFATWFDVGVDHTLYPIISPVMSLTLMAITARCISLNLLNTDPPVTVVCCRACLPFFEKSPLSGAVYKLQLTSLYKELLEAFGTINYKLTQKEIEFGEECIKKLDALLPAQAPSDVNEKDVHEKAKVSIALAQIRLNRNPGFDFVSYAPSSGKAASRSDRETLKAYVSNKQEGLKHDLKLKEGVHLMQEAYEDMQDVLHCIGALVKFGEKEMAVESFHVAESSYQKLFRSQVSQKSFDLDASLIFTIPQTIVLPSIAPFLRVDPQLVANGVLRWKCLTSEF